MTDVLATGILEDAEKIVRGLTEDDAVRMRAIGEHKVAKSTRKNYISQWKSFTCWAANRKVSALPAAPEHVAAYLAERSCTASTAMM